MSNIIEILWYKHNAKCEANYSWIFYDNKNEINILYLQQIEKYTFLTHPTSLVEAIAFAKKYQEKKGNQHEKMLVLLIHSKSTVYSLLFILVFFILLSVLEYNYIIQVFCLFKSMLNELTFIQMINK